MALMNCRRARKAIFRFVDGLSDEKMQLDLEQHLAGCAACETLARSLARSLDLVRRTPQETLDENFNWKVRLAIHKERAATRARAASTGSLFHVWNLRFAASAAAGVTVAIAAGWLAVASGLILPAGDQGLVAESGRELSRPLPAEPAKEERVAQPTAQPAWRGDLRDQPAGPSVVSGGNRTQAGKASRVGAIDEMASSSAALDSLIRAETAGMTEADRERYLRVRIERLQTFLEKRDSTR
jgi:anti-sigma factor RsiW